MVSRNDFTIITNGQGEAVVKLYTKKHVYTTKIKDMTIIDAWKDESISNDSLNYLADLAKSGSKKVRF